MIPVKKFMRSVSFSGCNSLKTFPVFYNSFFYISFQILSALSYSCFVFFSCSTLFQLLGILFFLFFSCKNHKGFWMFTKEMTKTLLNSGPPGIELRTPAINHDFLTLFQESYCFSVKFLTNMSTLINLQAVLVWNGCRSEVCERTEPKT